MISVLIITLTLLGCTNTSTGNPTPKDFLQYDDADIFLLDGIVYSNARDVEWIQELEYTLGEKIGEITKQTSKARSFKNGTANKLAIGTKLYSTDSDSIIVIAIVNGKEIPYLKMIEG